MKTAALLCAVLATAAIAQPHQHGGNKRRHVHGKHQKRAIVTEWVTETAYVTEYIDATSTVWVSPEGSAAPSSSVPGQFFEPGDKPSSTTLSTTTKPAPVPTPVQPSIEQAPAPAPPSSTSTSTSVYVAPPVPEVPTVQPAPQPTTTSVYVPPPPPPAPTTTVAPAPAPQPSSPPPAAPTSASPGGGGSGEMHTGDMTFYAVGLGACGEDDSGKDRTENIVALSQHLMGPVSNGNEYCGKKIKITVGGKSTTATVRDKCMGCAPNNIDVSEKCFLELFSDLGVGRDTVQWSFIN
ncbi:allergen asp f7 [Colletotrichum musicola]|uniref:Allergen asp f7 n=1 Tax=Colletotrichum musicola TaxID=2175873 RepID=A0A8H6U9R9_9PEZI|nr:allergen asp f7 [Colletotrichum musicola]